tara:strand:- start:945 stop:3209 length:2265 start_codon:yes stop_codon:yes gene_type:complete
MAIKLYKSQVNVSKQQSSVPTAKLEGNFGQAVFEGQQQLLNTTMEIEQRHRSMQEDKEFIEQTTKYNEDLNQIIVDHNKLNNYDEGMLSYETATNELLTNTTANIKNNNVKRRVEEHALRHNSAYKIDIGKNIRTNSAKIFKDSIELKKNEVFNEMITGNLDLQNKDYQTYFTGPNSFYQMELDAGTIPGGVTEESYRQTLENEFEYAQANFLIDTNVDQFLELDKKKKYNNLEPKVLIALRSKANATKNSNASAANTMLTSQKNEILDKINIALDPLKEGFSFNVDSVNSLIDQAKIINETLKANGKPNIDDKIFELESAFDTYEYVQPFLNKPTLELENGYMAQGDEDKTQEQFYPGIQYFTEELAATTGTENFNIQNMYRQKALEKIKVFREKNEESNLLGIAQTSNIKNNNAHVAVIDFENFEPTELLNRKLIVPHVAETYQKLPQFFLPEERNQINEIFASGNKLEITKTMAAITDIAGSENAPLAFNEVGLSGYTGLAHVATLRSINGPSIELENAIDAHVLMNREENKDIFKNFDPRKEGTKLSETSLSLDVFRLNTFSDDTNLYKQVFDSAEIIFYGKLLKEPTLLNKTSQENPADTNLANNLWKESLQIAAGHHDGKGGLQDYFDVTTIIPDFLPNQKSTINPLDKNPDFASILSRIMDDELLLKATGGKQIVEVLRNDEGEEYTEPAKAEDLFGEPDVNLYFIGDNQYLLINGNPTMSEEIYMDENKQAVVINMNKIKNEILNN